MEENDIEKFCVLIISYGRADNCLTAEWLMRKKYSLPWYIVCSTDDPTLEEYKKKYGKRVVVFDKDFIEFDRMDNFGIKKVGSYARQACFPIAEKLGYRFFLSLDDDYIKLLWRYVNKEETRLCTREVGNLEGAFGAMFRFLNSSEHIWEVDFVINVLFFGGVRTNIVWQDKNIRAANSHFNDVQKWIDYKGTFGDDINDFVSYSAVGKLFCSISLAAVDMQSNKTQKGGMRESYSEMTNYKTYYYVLMCNPSACKLSWRPNRDINVTTKTNACEVKILNEKWRKKD